LYIYINIKTSFRYQVGEYLVIKHGSSLIPVVVSTRIEKSLFLFCSC